MGRNQSRQGRVKSTFPTKTTRCGGKVFSLTTSNGLPAFDSQAQWEVLFFRSPSPELRAHVHHPVLLCSLWERARGSERLAARPDEVRGMLAHRAGAAAGERGRKFQV